MTGAATRLGYFLSQPVWTNNNGSSRDDDASKLRARLDRIPIPELEARYRDCLDRSVGDVLEAVLGEGALKAKEA